MQKKIPAKITRVPWRIVDDRAVIVQTGAGRVHELNEVGTWLWCRADGSLDASSIAMNLSKEFEIDPEQAQRDVDQFYSQLAELGLVTFGAPTDADT